MTEGEAIQIIVEHMKGLFPRTCPKCNRRFATLRDFYLNTTPVGSPVSYDLEVNELRPLRPLGAVAVSECQCGMAIALTSGGMPLFRLWALLLWAKYETLRRGITAKELFQHLRVQIRNEVIAGPEKRK